MTKQRKGSLVDLAYDALKRKIIKRDLKPGEYLDEKLLMTEIGVGRTPLRQAILLLKNENFIESQVNKSSYIKEFSLDEVKELYETLAIVEKNVAFLAALRVNAHELEGIRAVQRKLDHMIEKSEKSLDPNEYEKLCWEFNELNFEFHIRIAAAGKNRFLQKVHYGIRNQAERFSSVTFIRMMENSTEKREYIQNISTQHHEIIRCLEHHDQTRITDLMVKHVIFFQNQIFNSMMEISYA